MKQGTPKRRQGRLRPFRSMTMTERYAMINEFHGGGEPETWTKRYRKARARRRTR